ncbi:hypothetical protein EPO14_01215 [Patescibacteria group bacterium]|nr:MAG: hypothetical protein EPO14_01215 [Patescibacteria group bacterium]
MSKNLDSWLQHDRFFTDEDSLKPILDGHAVKRTVFWAALFRRGKVGLASTTAERFVRRLFHPTKTVLRPELIEGSLGREGFTG